VGSTVIGVSPPRLKAVTTAVSLTVEGTGARRAGFAEPERDRGALYAGAAGRWHRAGSAPPRAGTPPTTLAGLSESGHDCFSHSVSSCNIYHTLAVVPHSAGWTAGTPFWRLIFWFFIELSRFILCLRRSGIRRCGRMHV
jgi:hypothetical protein